MEAEITRITKTVAMWFLMTAVLALAAAPAFAEQTTPRGALRKAIEALDNNQTHEALRAAHQATLMLTQRDKFHIRKTVLVEQGASGWGVYTERKSNVYAPGEKILLYIEPGAFKYGGPEGRFDFGFTVDFRVSQPDGNILGGQDEFGKFPFQSLRPNTEIFLDLTLTLTGVPAGKYILKIAVHDMVSKEVSTDDIPIEFSEGAAASSE